MINNMKINIISSIKTPNHQKLESHDVIAQEFMNHFQATLSKMVSKRRFDTMKITYHIPKLVTREHNDLLLKEITMQEVELTIIEMPMCKSVGLDNFTTDFYHDC